MDSYVVAACIAFFGVLVSITGSYITNERIARKNNIVQKEIAEQQIDANLMAKARIDWIEKVRENTANLISVLLTLQKEEKDFNLIWENGEKYSEILKLYFSSKINYKIEKDIFIEKNMLKTSTKAKEILFNIESNENKNQYIIEYISCLMKMHRNDHHTNVKKNVISFIKAKEKKDYELSKIGKIEYEYETVELDDGSFVEANMPVIVDPKNENSSRYNELQYSIKKLDTVLVNYNKMLELFESSVTEFSSIISLYLKIEWDKAKQGK
ncbi:hypothetical protein [Carnobacterium maltaromaticum]|uniref:hypothetical protein n=1 Tax=Carnobacterium maltaromaticum TaxID=2751 RepID=UPI0039B055F4